MNNSLSVLYACTLTGVDEKTDLDRLAKLSIKYPFVEWGILIGSKSGTGEKNRYPSESWIRTQFLPIVKPLACLSSLHLCGSKVKNFLYEETNSDLVSLTQCFDRCQFNIGQFTVEESPTMIHMLGSGKLGRTIPIFPFKRSTFPVWTLSQVSHRNVHFLVDDSGGRGKEIEEFIQPIPGSMFGYAGGIGPDNVDKTLRSVLTHVGIGYTWIDMETNVRTDDWFDLDKVEQVLEKVDLVQKE